MVDRKIYNRYFEPIVQPGEFLEFFPRDVLKSGDVGVRVITIYPLPLKRLNLCDSTHLSANLTTAESSEDELDDLDLDDGELAQYRLIPISDFALTYLAMPKGRPLMYNKSTQFEINTILDDARSNPAVEHLQLNEIFKWEDTDLYYKAKSNTDTLTAAYLAVFGYRFICELVKAFPTGIRPLCVPVTGYPGLSK